MIIERVAVFGIMYKRSRFNPTGREQKRIYALEDSFGFGYSGRFAGLGGNWNIDRPPDRNRGSSQLGRSGDPDYRGCIVFGNLVLYFFDRSGLCGQEPKEGLISDSV